MRKLFSLITFMFVLTSVGPSVYAATLPASDLDSIYRDTVWYDTSSGLAASCSDSSSSSSAVNLTSIAQTYKLQSAIAKKVGGEVLGSYHADEPPVTPASTMKLIIGDVLLRYGTDLNTTVKVTADVYYDHSNDIAGKPGQTTLANALYQMLNQSSNTAANVIMKYIGGTNSQTQNVQTFTNKADGYGYTNTTVRGYYDPSNDGKNSSTIGDEANAMDHIFTGNGFGYALAQKALIEAAGTFGQPPGDNYYGVDDDANKWAGTSAVAGNVGRFNISGKEYIIGLYTNRSDSDPQAISDIKNGSAAIASAISKSLSGSNSATTVLVGADQEQQVWNYFKGQGLSDAQVAGIMGNLQQESSFDPERMQGGGDSQNPLDAGSGGWGLAQWTPGSRILNDVKDNNVSGPIYGMLTQLNLIMAQMKGVSPPGVTNMLPGLQKINDPAQAALYFLDNFERGTDPDGVRESNAQQIMQKYGNGSFVGCSGSSISPDCQSTTGTARILCAAKKYDPVSYLESTEAGHQGGAAWHQSCPVIGPSCVLDCSGLVNIAVYDIYNIDLKENTFTEASDSQYWRPVPFSQLQPGDLIQPATRSGEHVEIVDHVEGSTIYTFGAHTANVAQPDQVGPAAWKERSGDFYLRYVGPGT